MILKMKVFLWSSFASLVAVLGFSGCGPKKEVQKLTLTGSSTVAPLIADIAKRFEEEHSGIRISVQTGGSSRGISDAGSGLADIGMASRELKSGEEGLVATRIAVDGVALISHAENPVEELSHEQILAIYRGEIQNWKELGGQDQEIVVVNKAEGTGTLEVFLKHLQLDSADVKSDLIVGENQQAIKTVAGNKNAIGYVSIGAAEYEAEHGVPIHLMTVDGVQPTSKTVADGTYAISRPLLLITKGAPSGLAERFIEYAQAAKVRDLVEDHLYVAIAN